MPRYGWSWVLRAAWALPLLALAALLAGALIPANPGWHQAREGVRIYVADNGVHTDLILPVAAAGVDWRELVRPGDVADPRRAGASHLSFGWGDRAFYLETPDWSAMRPATALHALIGSSSTVLHVGHVPEPSAGRRIRPLVLRPDEYRRLAAFVRATFAEGPSRPGYGAADAFYAARGRYSAVNSCNQWTGRALRAAGVRMGVWTPLPISVMLRL